MANKKIYTVACSHLDTIWSWDFETTVSKYIYNTLVDNFELFKKYPTYTFSFEGSYRYELMEEYYPELFEQMKEYIAQGRWNVTGSAFENGDVNCPSPESLFRNILIGNSYFAEKFGKRSCDIFLPDCFGFGWALPSIAHHSNLKGFTTQKLAWGSAYGVPFDIGKWYGVDGNYIYASVNPHDYYFTLTKLRDWDFVTDKIKENEKFGLDWTYMFHGIGDRGGAPEESSVKFVEDEISKNDDNDIEVISASADQIYRDIDTSLPQSVKDNLPVWKTELVMQNHGVGGYTSRAIGKRWNSKCQETADMAERAGVMASYFGVADYNESVLERAWKRCIAHQFHDDTPGTSVQRAYKRSWNDYAMSINQFSGELEGYIGAMSRMMNTNACKGTPLLVFNSLECDRRGVVKARIENVEQNYVRIFDGKGREVPSQIIASDDKTKEVIFIADVKSLGVAVYDARESEEKCKITSTLKIKSPVMENEKYIVTLNRGGNITSIIDKEDNNREILEKPIITALFNYTGSKDWPAWEMNYEEANKEPDRIPQLVSVKMAENGPVRVAFEIKQKDKKSEFTTYICLTSGGKVVEVYNEIEWQSMRTLCKNRFAFTASNEKATFDLGLGAIQRENMSEKLFEVPAQKWADITDKSGDFGVSVISECKHGWDKFNDNTLRLTAIHTPKKNYRIDSMQSMMDLGLNLYSYAIYSHKGNVGADTQLEARLFTSPLTAVAVAKQKGSLGISYSFGKVNTNDVIIRCIKKKHHSDNDEIIVRINEASNKEVKNFRLSLGDGIESATEVWASEEYRGEAVVENGQLVCDLKPYEVKTFSIKLASPKKVGTKAISKSITLDRTVSTTHIPDSLLPSQITFATTVFDINKNALSVCKGQKIEVESGNSLKILAASLKGDIVEQFMVNGVVKNVKINSIDGAYARWDLYDFKETAYIKDGKIGYEFTHSVDNKGNTLFAKGLYFWVIEFDGTVVLPDNENIVILAATETNEKPAALVTPIMDKIENNRPFTFHKNLKEKLWYISSKMVWALNDKDNFLTHWNNGKNGRRVEQTGKRAKTRTVDSVGH